MTYKRVLIVFLCILMLASLVNANLSLRNIFIKKELNTTDEIVKDVEQSIKNLSLLNKILFFILLALTIFFMFFAIKYGFKVLFFLLLVILLIAIMIYISKVL